MIFRSRQILAPGGMRYEKQPADTEFRPENGTDGTGWDQMSLAGLSEEELRKMDPDDRVAALERANLDPYDFIYLAC